MLARLRSVLNHIPPFPSATMSTAIHNTNKACCTIPPVLSDYEPKGSFKSVGDFKTVYVTGPEKSDNAIICVFDIFGFFPQTQQGADIIASTLNTTVYMPDFFEPNPPFPISSYPPITAKQKADIQAFFGGVGSPPLSIAKLTAFGNYLKSTETKSVGVYGFCWGGKVVVSTAGENTPFSAVSIVHPAMLSVEDAKKLTVPLAIYASHDESKDEYDSIVEVLSKKPFAALTDNKYYDNMFHGWAAARGDLKNEENLREYEDVYGRLVAFFKKSL